LASSKKNLTWQKWKPSGKTVGGAIIGQLLGQFIVLACSEYLSKKPSVELGMVFVGLCQAIAAYFLPGPVRGKR
jgi:hypothetical protein